MTCAAAAPAVAPTAAALAAAAVAAAAPAAEPPSCRAVVSLDLRRKALLVGVGCVLARSCGSSPGAFAAPSAAPSLAGASVAAASSADAERRALRRVRLLRTHRPRLPRRSPRTRPRRGWSRRRVRPPLRRSRHRTAATACSPPPSIDVHMHHVASRCNLSMCCSK